MLSYRPEAATPRALGVEAVIHMVSARVPKMVGELLVVWAAVMTSF